MPFRITHGALTVFDPSTCKVKSTKSAKYIKYFNSCELVYSEEYPSRSEAMKREWQVKKWTKAKKEALIKGDLILLKRALTLYNSYHSFTSVKLPSFRKQ